MFRLESAGLQLYAQIPPTLQVVEYEVGPEILPADIHTHLMSDIRAPPPSSVSVRVIFLTNAASI